VKKPFFIVEGGSPLYTRRKVGRTDCLEMGKPLYARPAEIVFRVETPTSKKGSGEQ